MTAATCRSDRTPSPPRRAVACAGNPPSAPAPRRRHVPASSTAHRQQLSAEEQQAGGITPELVRISIGHRVPRRPRVAADTAGASDVRNLATHPASSSAGGR